MGSYIGIYVRVGNEAFRETTKATVTAIAKRLLREFRIPPAGEDDKQQHNKDGVENNGQGFAPTDIQRKCQSRSGNRALPILYIASDVGRKTQAFNELYRSFPCVYRLHDFEPFMERLKFVTSPIDGDYMFHYFIQLVDLIVVSKGSRFIGPEKTAFSQYALRLHKQWLGSQPN
jgi:hypothetical protein